MILRVVPKQSFIYFLVEDTGIGLTLARSLSRRMGGDIVLDTSYTFGARFIFCLPINEE